MIQLVFVLIIAGVALYFIPMDAAVRNIIIGVIVISVIAWVGTHYFGVKLG